MVDALQVDARDASFPDGEAGVVLGARVEVQGTMIGGVVVAREVDVDVDDVARQYELHGR